MLTEAKVTTGSLIPGTTPLQASRQQALSFSSDELDSDSSTRDMFEWLSLSELAAIEVSRDIWPSRFRGAPDVPSYLEWHRKVRPGGDLHAPDRMVQLAAVNIKAKSVQEIASALVLMMDHFHKTRTDPAISSGDFQRPPGVRCSPIDSLRIFFKSLRCYIM